MRVTAAVLPLLFVAVLFAATPALAGETVTFPTSDGLKIVGTFYASGRKGAAAVVALPMYRHDRSSWEPVAERFTKAGMDFLAIDLRGHGDSAVQDGKDLSEGVKTRDPKLFNAMWRDAVAAREFLVSKGSDGNRIGLLGASVGCSVAIDAASRTESVLGVCVMTPGKNYLGVDTMSDLAAYGDRPLLILSSKEEAGVGATAIAKKLGAAAELVLYEAKRVHGTRMFGEVAGVEEKIVGWFADLLGASVALDGRMDARERPDHPFWNHEAKLIFHVKATRRWMHVVVAAKEGVALPAALAVGWSSATRPGDGRRVRWNSAGGTWRHEILREGKWSPMRRKKAANRPEPGAARGEVVELLIPIGKRGIGLTVGADLRLQLATETPKGPVTSGWMPLLK